MIKFEGYDEVIERVYRFNQEHVFQYWDKLLDSEKLELLDDLSGINFQLLKQIYSHTGEDEKIEFSPAPFIPLPVNEKDKILFGEAARIGASHISGGKVAAFLVAGGQGSRLGFDGPKGKFPIGPVSGKTLFHFHAEKIKASEKKYGASIPFLIMTSRDNHTETEIFFKKQNFFGLDPANVHLFPQNMIPSLDLSGKLILSETNRIFMNPDGHGGSLTALRTSGALKKLQELKIETLSYFQVDNPLVKIIDPVFIGFHVMNQADISSKALKKLYPEEKTGIFVQFSNGTPGIVEYSDMPEDKIFAKDPDGGILYSAANPAIHLFSISFVSELTDSGSISLPYHIAKKKITAVIDGRHSEIAGYKFEKFVFDALPLSAKNVILEVLREEEFAPVKNASGQDSADSAKELMTALNRKWLASRGISVPASVREVEISPLTALSPEDLPEGIVVPDKEKVLIA
ncbi:MAG TPA: UDPGP type 1 family protein [Spirochaetota bacterium]|nr:UDPGP type 1 family protein [Spirochaetota bacterium]HPS87648.1 UDPGP type 1 family protein [Spirochaetota bacterium]